MNHTKRAIIIKLETMSRIPKNGKLNLTANDIEIYQNTMFAWFKRWSSGDGRENTVNHLNQFFDHVLLTTDDMIDCVIGSSKIITMNDECKNKADDLSTIGLALANSIAGVNNLRETYIKDEKTNAQLRFICEQCIAIQYHKIIETLESYNPKLIPKLKSDIKDLINLYSPSYKRGQENSPKINETKNDDEN
jgi:hypothetical protein